MRILSIVLFAFALIYSALAQEEEGHFSVGANPASRSDSDDNDFYVSFNVDSNLMPSPSEGFSINNGGYVYNGIIPVENRGAFRDFEISAGARKRLKGNVSFRYEGGYRRTHFDLGNPTYTRVDFSPISVEEINRIVDMEGSLDISGLRGGGFFDFGLGNSGNFMYVGSSLGYMNLTSRYNIAIGDFNGSMDDSDKTMSQSFELGVILNLRKNIDLSLGYDFTHVNDVTLLQNDGGILTFMPGNSHIFRVGILHFFKK